MLLVKSMSGGYTAASMKWMEQSIKAAEEQFKNHSDRAIAMALSMQMSMKDEVAKKHNRRKLNINE